MTALISWLAGDTCPECGSATHMTDTGGTMTEYCPECGWSATWQAWQAGGAG